MKASKFKKLGILSIVAVMMAAFLSFNVASAEGEENKSTIAFTSDIKTADVPELYVDLYRIANIEWNGSESYYYLSFEEGNKYQESFKDLENGRISDEFNPASYAIKCATIAVQNEGITPAEADLVVSRNNDPSSPEATTKSLDNGLYLAIARGKTSDYSDGKYYKIDENGNFVSYVLADSKAKEYDFSPYLVFLNEETKVGITKADLKYSIISLDKGELVIEKELRVFGGTPVTFVFSYDIYDPDNSTKVIRSDVASITYTNADFVGDVLADDFFKSITISNIPVGSKVVVEEIYAGAGYKIQDNDPSSKEVEIKVPVSKKEEPGYEPAKVSFENTKDEDDNKKGYGINNEFVYETSGWSFNKSSGGSDQ